MIKHATPPLVYKDYSTPDAKEEKPSVLVHAFQDLLNRALDAGHHRAGG